VAHTHYYGLIGDSHTKGNRGGGEDGTTAPIVLGPAEQLLLTFGEHNVQVNDVIAQAVGGLIPYRARVVAVVSTVLLVVEPMAAAAGDYPVFSNGERRPFWETYSNAHLTVNGEAVSQTPGSEDPANWSIAAVTDSQLVEQLNDDDLLRPTDSPMYWDPLAQEAGTVTISGFNNQSGGDGVAPGDRVTVTDGGSNNGAFTVIGIEAIDSVAETATLRVSRVSGTIVGELTNTDSLRTLTGVEVVAYTAAAAPGMWVPHCTSPSLGADIDDLSGTSGVTIGSKWLIPPRGNRGKRTGSNSIGPDVRIARAAEAAHANVPDVNDRGARLLSFSSFDGAPGLGIEGGITLQRVDMTGVVGTFVTGETVTSDGDPQWSAKVAGHEGGILYVYGTNGVTLSNGDALLGAGGATGTATRAALGWQKGSEYFNQFLAEISTALAAPNALHNNQAAKWERLFLMPWEGELTPFARLTATPALAMFNHLANDPAIGRAEWIRFANDIRTALGNADMPIRAWVHSARSQASILSGSLAAGTVTAGVRARIKDLGAYIPNFTVIDSDLRGHQMQHQDDGEAEFFLRTQDYLDLGQALWNGSVNFTQSAVSGNYKILPVVVVAGSQSQFLGFNVLNSTPGGTTGRGLTYVDHDPDLYPSIDFVPQGLTQVVDTRDANLLKWNEQTLDLEVLDCNHNCNTFWRAEAAYQTSGPEVSLMQRLKMRWGKDATLGSSTLKLSGKIALFKAAVGGSCMNPFAVVGAGCWSPALQTRPFTTVQVVVTHEGGNAVFTATSGTPFTTYVGSSHTIVISDGASMQGAGGRNTPLYDTNQAFEVTNTSFKVSDPNGLIANGTETVKISWGPPPLWPELVRQWKAFVQKCFEKGYIPRPVVLGQEQGETDLGLGATYSTHLAAFWNAFLELCDLREDKADDPIAKFIVQLHQYSPYAGTAQKPALAEIAAIRSAQAAMASALGNCALIDPTPLALEANDVLPQGGVFYTPAFPRQFRLENGLHQTGRSQITKGYMIDAGLSQLGSSLIPSHPFTGKTVAEVGAINGVGTLELPS